MTTTDTFVIETHELGKAYRGVQALQALDLRVAQHSIFGFLGPNGAGKTTTIKLLLGLARPSTGSAKIFGMDVVRDGLQVRQRVGYLAQDPRFYESMTAREILRFTAHFFFAGPKAAIDERIVEVLDLVGMTNRADRPARTLSGGERQRLGIAQAQINHPELLILDEPAAALDPEGRHDVLEIMARLRQHTTIFYSTHILSDVQRVSDTVAILKGGRLIAQAPVEELLAGHQTARFTLVARGPSAEAQRLIAAQPWVSTVEVTASNGNTRWQVTVADEAAAEARLLGLVQACDGLTVLEFGRKVADLEEVFLELVEGGNHGKQ